MTEIDGDWWRNMRQKPVDEYHPLPVGLVKPPSEAEMAEKKAEAELGSSPLPEKPASYVDGNVLRWNLGGYRGPQTGCG